MLLQTLKNELDRNKEIMLNFSSFVVGSVVSVGSVAISIVVKTNGMTPTTAAQIANWLLEFTCLMMTNKNKFRNNYSTIGISYFFLSVKVAGEKFFR